jgi:hypothetical protein
MVCRENLQQIHVSVSMLMVCHMKHQSAVFNQ